MGNDSQLGGRFISALAAGAESSWPASEAASKAKRLRTELMGLLGDEVANALLRSVTRDGRLHPGLAAPVVGRVLNSEKQQYTPEAEAEAAFANAAQFASRATIVA
jgi:hypothetical protein